MANKEHVKLIKKSVEEWNEWRKENPKAKPDLSKARFSWKDLQEADLSKADLYGANLRGADLREAILGSAQLTGTNFKAANLHGVDLSEAYFFEVNFFEANLSETDLRGTDLTSAICFVSTKFGPLMIFLERWFAYNETKRGDMYENQEGNA